MTSIFEEIYSYAPKWRDLVNKRVQELKIKKISLSLNSMSIDIHNATWCPDCERETIELMALILINSSSLDINVYSYEVLDTYKKQKKEGSLPIKCLPTFIFKRNNEEILRIEENSEERLLNTLRNLD